MKRGEVWLVDLDPGRGSETGKRRLALVVQNDLANEASPTVTVIPLTGSTGRVYPFQVLLPAGEGGLPKPSKALCEQIRTVSRVRLVRCLGTVSPERLSEVRKAVDRHLWFDLEGRRGD